MPVYKLPRNKEFWEQQFEKYPTRQACAKALGCSTRTITEYLSQLELIWPRDGPIRKLSLEELKEMVKTAGGLQPAAKLLRVHHSTISEKLGSLGVSYNDIMREYQAEIAPVLNPPIEATGDRVISCDWHSPFVSLMWVDRLLAVAKREHIRSLIIAGDFTDFDRLSWWLKQSNAEDMATRLDDELAFSEMLLEKLESWFTSFEFLGGNHWWRLLRHISTSVSSQRLLGLLGKKDDPRYKISGYFQWMLIDGKVRISHPMGRGRKLDFTLPRDISILYPDQWIVTTHRHRAMEGFTPDGRPTVEVGWMGDTIRMRYVQHVDSTYYQWVNGFCVYKNGKLRSYTEYNTDWEAYG